jgi:hypothetical protein
MINIDDPRICMGADGRTMPLDGRPLALMGVGTRSWLAVRYLGSRSGPW